MDNSALIYRLFRSTLTIALALTLGVIVLGAFTRLKDAGLGCPDWPGCFGQLIPATFEQKAMTEMVHRYLAGLLSVLILILAGLSLYGRKIPAIPRVLPLILPFLILFQAILGMWTVTWKLHPTVVMGHLLGGFSLLALVWLTFLQSRKIPIVSPIDRQLFGLPAIIGLIILIIQIALGGWTSANYAALSCPDFPQCQSHWIPPLDFQQAFTLFHPIGQNFEFGILDNTPRVTIHFVHRLGALLTALVIGGLALSVYFKTQTPALKKLALITMILLITQISLGITNVLAFLPLSIAVAHNAVAAILLLAMLTWVYLLSGPRSMS